MLKRTYEKIYSLFEKAGGYLPTRTLIDNRVSTIHIKELLENGDIEKVSHGNYWGTFLNIKKPKDYKYLEASMANGKAVICGPSACFYHGLLKNEPDKLFVATKRTDRGGMKLDFPVSRHYFSENGYEDHMTSYVKNGVTIKIYDIDRSVADSIRFRDSIDEKTLDEILQAYRKSSKKNLKKCYEYAESMRVGRIVRDMIENS